MRKLNLLGGCLALAVFVAAPASGDHTTVDFCIRGAYDYDLEFTKQTGPPHEYWVVSGFASRIPSVPVNGTAHVREDTEIDPGTGLPTTVLKLVVGLTEHYEFPGVWPHPLGNTVIVLKRNPPPDFTLTGTYKTTLFGGDGARQELVGAAQRIDCSVIPAASSLEQ
jgi:hypothetical protein